MELNGRSAYDAAMTIAEPLTQMSMLDGLNSMLSSVGYGENPLSDLLTGAVTDYVSQAVPTSFGQIARTVDPVRRTTYDDKNIGVPSIVQKMAQKNVRAICAKTFIHEIYTKREYNEKKEMVKMLHNEARKLLVEGYERTHDVHGIAKAYGVTEREVYRLVKQKRDTGSVELRTSQRGRKPKMTEKDLERLRAAIEKTPDKTLGELKEELNLPCSESRLSRIVREKLGFRRKKKVIHASEQERPRCTGKA